MSAFDRPPPAFHPRPEFRREKGSERARENQTDGFVWSRDGSLSLGSRIPDPGSSARNPRHAPRIRISGFISGGRRPHPNIHAWMHLEIVEVLALASEAAGSQHWSRNTARPRYSLSARDVAERSFVHSFTCFDVAERVETDYDIVFAGRVSILSVRKMFLRYCCSGARQSQRGYPHRG